MEKLSINLLPAEIATQGLQQQRLYRIKFFGVVTVLTLVFLSSVTIALRLLQGQNIKKSESQFQELTTRVQNFKTTESSLGVLKNRLNAIQNLALQPSKQRTLYSQVISLLPSSLLVTSVSLDKSGNMSLSASTSDYVGFDNFLKSLSSTKDIKVSKVAVDNLIIGRDGVFRVNLKISP